MNHESEPFIVEEEDKVTFMKIYLLKAEQLGDLILYKLIGLVRIVQLLIDCEKFPVTSEKHIKPKLNSNSFLDSLIKVGTLEQLDIFALTRSKPYELQTPTLILVRNLFEEYKHAFYNHSEYFILYYVFQ